MDYLIVLFHTAQLLYRAIHISVFSGSVTISNCFDDLVTAVFKSDGPGFVEVAAIVIADGYLCVRRVLVEGKCLQRLHVFSVAFQYYFVVDQHHISFAAEGFKRKEVELKATITSRNSDRKGICFIKEVLSEECK